MISKRLIKYFLIRLVVLIIPLLILGLLLMIPEEGGNHGSHGRADRGLGIAIFGGIWLHIFALIMFFEILKSIVKKTPFWKVSLILLLIVIVPILRLAFLMGAFS